MFEEQCIHALVFWLVFWLGLVCVNNIVPQCYLWTHLKERGILVSFCALLNPPTLSGLHVFSLFAFIWQFDEISPNSSDSPKSSNPPTLSGLHVFSLLAYLPIHQNRQIRWQDFVKTAKFVIACISGHKCFMCEGERAFDNQNRLHKQISFSLTDHLLQFPGTNTTGELCAGVVKAPGLFEKNPAQHAADLTIIESREEIKAAFVNSATGAPKEIECIRVDGSSDEGPAHHEVQYWGTKSTF